MTNEEDKEYIFRWGLPLQDLYHVALKFYKEKEGSAIQFSYDEKLKLIAFTKQVAHGNYSEDTLPPVGVLDVIGRDRRIAWQALVGMSQRDAMAGFINLVDKLCLHFNTYVQAHKAEMEQQKKIEEERKKKEIEEAEKERLENEEKAAKERLQQQDEMNRRLIQEALNQQTFHQFKAYSEQQYPGNPEQQAVLIRQLQDQHYHQYMQQLQHQSQYSQDGSSVQAEEDSVEEDEVPVNKAYVSRIMGEDSDEESEGVNHPELCPPSMWTRKDIQEFKTQVKKEKETIIKIGHGETVTIRIPTNEGGTCLFWEFATDNYDLGFGVYFEWGKSLTSEVSIHVTDSDDETEDEAETGDNTASEESNIGVKHMLGDNEKSDVSVIVPIYRRDCHEEVYAGSHVNPGEGVYILKFDNSYSLWRSKTLYYRIYYTQ